MRMIKNKNHKVAIVMGSQSDYSTMKYAVNVLKILKIKHEIKIVSAETILISCLILSILSTFTAYFIVE